MPNPKYDVIYQTIKQEILDGKYARGDHLPSENEYCERFDVTRNTVRRALAMLTQEGFVMPRHGRGVQVIWKPQEFRNIFSIGGIESLKEASERNHRKLETRVLSFRILTCDKSLSEMTGFDIGSEVYYIDRVRSIDGEPIIHDTSYFLRSEAKGLSRKIAAQSIYDYLENTVGLTITTSLRKVTAERATDKDIRCLKLTDDCDFLLVITGQVFHSGGIMFEYTQSRHRPDKVCFIESAVRRSI